MIDNNKLLLKCEKCGLYYEVLIGVIGNYTCRGCGSTQVTLNPIVITKTPETGRRINNIGRGRIAKSVETDNT